MKQQSLVDRLKHLRYNNAKGRVIPLHHAFKTVHLSSFSRMSAVVLPVLFVSLIWLFLPMILDAWAGIFSFWMNHIYEGQVGFEPETILGQDVFLPYPMLAADLPTVHAVWLNLIICIIGFVVSLLIPSRIAPLTYLIRTTFLIQASASIERLLSPNFFPYTLKLYTTDALMMCVYMLSVVPVLLGMIYYIFDFSLGRKILLTLWIIAFYVVAIPCQYMMHAYIVHEGTLLFLPILYILFGVLMDVLMFIAIYSFGMSWRSRKAALTGRGL